MKDTIILHGYIIKLDTYYMDVENSGISIFKKSGGGNIYALYFLSFSALVNFIKHGGNEHPLTPSSYSESEIGNLQEFNISFGEKPEMKPTHEELVDIAKKVKPPLWATHIAVRTDTGKAEPCIWCQVWKEYVEGPYLESGIAYSQRLWEFFEIDELDKT